MNNIKMSELTVVDTCLHHWFLSTHRLNISRPSAIFSFAILTTDVAKILYSSDGPSLFSAGVKRQASHEGKQRTQLQMLSARFENIIS
jgi:hypothetical protein